MSEPGSPPEPRPPQPPSALRKKLPPPMLFLVAAMLLMVLVNTFSTASDEIYFSYFIERLEEGDVERCVIEPSRVQIWFRREIPLRRDVGDSTDTVRTSTTAHVSIPPNLPPEELQERLDRLGVEYRFIAASPFSGLLVYWIPSLLLLLLIGFFMFRSMGRAESMFGFGRSRAKVVPEKDIETTFGDVAGVDEARAELEEIVDFLKHPERYIALGGKIPKGVLLLGPPGCGKTLVARAMAGEAGVPFFSLSGSEFVEMFVGVGAARVRDLFSQAKALAPSIIFIDEIDAVGRQRGAGIGGGHDEREQTLNQLLVEMDGFESEKGTIVVAATNRPDVLDPALLRPGRFDRRVVIDQPDQRGRREILQVHVKKKPLSEDVDLDELARRTPGFTGADLANVLNEAALLAARHGKDRIERADVMEAVERVLEGPQRKSRVINARERLILSYHEMGHALVAIRSRFSDPVHKVSIIPRGANALGYTIMLPEEDRYIVLEDELIDRITGLFGGRAAERVVFGMISTGAANDLERASDIARRMVLKFGMREETGPVTYGHPDTEVFLGRDLGHEKNFSESTAEEIDDAVEQILRGCMKSAEEIIRDNRGVLDRLAEEVREREVVDGDRVREIVAEMDRLSPEERREVRNPVRLFDGNGRNSGDPPSV